MPCDTITTTTVAVPKMNGALLTEALTKLGLSPRQQQHVIIFQGGQYNTQTGDLNLRTYRTDKPAQLAAQVNQIKRMYSVAVLESQQKKFQWQGSVQWQPQTQSQKK